MRTTYVWLAFVATGLSAPLALTHCSGSSTKVTGGSDGGGSHPGSSGGSGSGGQSSGGTESSSGGGEDAEADGASSGQGASSSGGEGGAPGDGGASSSGAGTVVPVPEGGLPSEPMMVTCGSTTCDTTMTQSQVCCLGGDGGICTSVSSACPSQITQVCDEAADCTNAVCCQPLVCGEHSTTCQTTCAEGDFQPCRTDSECGATSDAGAAKKCIVQTCGTQMIGPTCGGAMVKLEACAYPTTVGFTTTWGPLPECTAD